MSVPDDDAFGPPPLSLRDSRFSAERTTRPWNWRLGVFLRSMAVIELLKGLAHWAGLIAAGGRPDALHGGAGWILGDALFAIADPVAAVGLWVGAAWGVAIWLIAAIAQIAASGLGGPSPADWFTISAVLFVMAVYIALSIKARREVP
ncbi:hypothetical protein IHQ68_00600 [Chelatococcus sambhunathii]|uniref:DoxX-like family n=1 Tax=Chelatococcus sambhunathii TaxID=363953 RepID=A0ABU1DAI7_9HYPH|nr:DUF6163 family protein [Chelatococcus sambhunathii]MDR4305127.1 hypothetical protein [Chelatococcus sambhunathii]